MTEKMTWMEVYNTIQDMKNKLTHRDYTTQVFSRGNYHDILCILSNDIQLAKDRSMHIKVNIQDSLITVSLRRKK